MKKSKAQETPVSKFLTTARVKSGLTQRFVSDKFGYTTPQFISNWERGIAQPPLKTLKKLADLYKVNADDLFEVVLKTTVAEITTNLKRRFFKRA